MPQYDMASFNRMQMLTDWYGTKDVPAQGFESNLTVNV